MKTFDASQFPFPLHSVTISVGGQILQDDTFAPYKKGEMHRMFSITKSFCSMAIGALIAEGKLSLTDRISSFFPEYVPESADPRLTEMTIGDMLTMRTCHKATTYKINMKENWVESFFITPPDHTPGTFFKYDTSSSHVLAALVKKLTGNGVLDYLRPVFLDSIGFSESAYILADPFGTEMGGSGLVCRPEDILKVSDFLLSLIAGKHENNIEHGDYDKAFFDRYASYIEEAVSPLVPTIGEGQTTDERQGYGRMFWSLRPLSAGESAFMMYGMGGQYAVIYPERHAVFVTTADSQNIKGGHQYILDEIRRVALTLPQLESTRLLPTPGQVSPAAESRTNDNAAGQPARADTPDGSSVPGDKAFSGTYTLLPNASGFTSLSMSESEIRLYEDGVTAPFVFSFSADEPWGETVDPKYGQKIFSRKKMLFDGSLLAETQILSDCAGSIRFLIKTDGDRIYLYSRKVEETYFNEFTGFFEGKRTE